jgi:putative ABC transport system permease protein
MFGLRHALRTLTRSPGPTFVVTSTLAIAIGATTIIASTIDGVWRAIPAVSTERLVFVASTDPRPSQAQAGMSGNLAMTGTSVPDLVDWAAQTTTVEQFGAFRYGTATLTGREAPSRVSLVRATAELFTLWGLSPALGRVFQPDDGRVGADPVVLLSHRYWEEEFSSDTAAVGTSVLLDGSAHTIVGVLPADVRAGIFADAELFVALPLDAGRFARDERRLFVTARLQPGVTRAQAEADLSGIANRLRVEFPNTNAQTGVIVRPLIEQLGGEIQTLLILLALIAGLVAAMACANVSNVVLAQAIGRQRESSVRTALGAQRFHHVKQIWVESVVISLVAGAAGVVIGGWGLALLKWLAGPQARLFADATINWRVAAAGMATAFILPLGFALLPALQSWRPNPADLKDGARAIGGGSAHRIRTVLVAVQVALAVVLLVQISLFARTAWNFRTMESGFNPQGVVTFRMELPAAKYSEERSAQFYRALLARIESLPEVVSAGTINRLPVADRELNARLKVDGAPPVQEEALPFTALSTVSRGYFDTLRVPVRQGRIFTDADFNGSGPAVAVVSEDAARLFWPGRDPIGARATIVAGGLPDSVVQIVGIVANARRPDVDQRTTPQVYVPSTWSPDRALAVVVRTDTPDPLQSVQAIRAQAAALEPNEPLFDVASMEQVLFNDQASVYTLAGLLGAIAMVALALAGVGIYGVVSFMVTQRTREIGLRMALGARPGAVLRMVIEQAAQPVAAGALLGAPAAFALVYLVSGAFSAIDVRNPANYVGVALSIALVASVASCVPARRAARIDPLVALRQD